LIAVDRTELCTTGGWVLETNNGLENITIKRINFEDYEDYNQWSQTALDNIPHVESVNIFLTYLGIDISKLRQYILKQLSLPAVAAPQTLCV
jgi:hypothetical protein